ncbi:MAG: CgeB family protein [Solirubrobacteraceae bacterium]
MRIAIVGANDNGSLTRSFTDGARDQGLDAHAVFADRLIAGWRPLFLARRFGVDGIASAPLSRALERRLSALDPDLIVVVKGRFIDGCCIERLRRRLRCPIINYYPDDPLWPGHDDRRLVAALHRYDEVVVWGERVAEGLQQLGISARVVPFGYDPTSYAPPRDSVAHRYDVVLVGQRYEAREAFVEPLTDLRLLVSGVGWDAAQADAVRRIASTRTYSAAEINRLYAESAFGLNILSPWNLPAHNMRTFEIPATGTAMVVTRTPEHERLFGEDGAVLVDEPAEARERILELLDDDEELRRLGERGRERIAPFTYTRRMRELLTPWR